MQAITSRFRTLSQEADISPKYVVETLLATSLHPASPKYGATNSRMLDFLRMHSNLTRRRFLGYGLVTLAGAAMVDGFLLEPGHPVAEHREIRLSRLPESFSGFRIAQITDIHFGPYMGQVGVQRAVRLAQEFRPDIVVLTGDFVSHPLGQTDGYAGAHHAEPCADVFAAWKGVPIVAILGNHDWWNRSEIVAGALADRGIKVLRNNSFPVERGEDRLWIARRGRRLRG